MFKKLCKHFFVVAKSWVWLIRFYLRRSFGSHGNNLGTDGITLVITSCNRPEQLKATLTSFFANCRTKFDKVIFIEDGDSVESINIAADMFRGHPNFISILNDSNLGQLNSIDVAYAYVETEWIFHLEEDWQFDCGGFIEFSMSAMESNTKILFVSLRSCKDQNGHPLKNCGNEWSTFKPFWKGVWCGFGFNPSVRRLSHYRLIGSRYGGWNKRETSIGLFYYLLGYRIIVKSDGSHYLRHSGGDCSTEHTYKKA